MPIVDIMLSSNRAMTGLWSQHSLAYYYRVQSTALTVAYL